MNCLFDAIFICCTLQQLRCSSFPLSFVKFGLKFINSWSILLLLVIKTATTNCDKAIRRQKRGYLINLNFPEKYQFHFHLRKIQQTSNVAPIFFWFRMKQNCIRWTMSIIRTRLTSYRNEYRMSFNNIDSMSIDICAPRRNFGKRIIGSSLSKNATKSHPQTKLTRPSWNVSTLSSTLNGKLHDAFDFYYGMD